MTEIQREQLDMTIIKLQTTIDSYNHTKEHSRRTALEDGECGYHQSAAFNKGQEFTLEYVIQDLKNILNALQNIE